MKITALSVRDFKRLRTLDIATDRELVILGGKNAAGKSSALDAIGAALGGAGLVPTAPIRTGADKGEVAVTLDGGIVIRRTFTRKDDGSIGGTLKITTADGMSPAKPQEWLNAKLGDLSLDPVAFLSAKPAEQAARLRRIAGVDTSAIDAKRKALYDSRRDIGRDGERDKGALDRMPHYPEAPAEPVTPEVVSPVFVPAPEPLVPVVVSASEILTELGDATRSEQAAAEAERVAADKRDREALAARDVTATMERTAAARRALDEAIERENAAKASAKAATEAAAKATEAADTARAAIIDPTPVRARLTSVEQTNGAATREAAEANARARAEVDAANNAARKAADEANVAARLAAEAVNAKVRANAARAVAAEGVAAMRAAYAAKSADISALDAERDAMLAAAKFPVPGLGFDADGVTFAGVPLEQASGADKIRISMGVALAANPTIRIVLIRDASLLDEDSMALVVALAEAADAQVWLERVGSADAGAVVIVDGAVAT